MTTTRSDTLLARLPLVFILVGLAGLYVGERALAGAARAAVDGLGLLVVAGLVLAYLRQRRAGGERRRAYTRVLAEYGVAMLGVLLYLLHSDLIGLFPDGKLGTVVMVLWPAVLLIGLAPAVAMELALSSMHKAPEVEPWRVRVASRGAHIVALGIIAFAGVNYAAAKWNRKIDVSYFKTTRAGSSTLALVDGLTKPVRFVLFFPPGNEVLEEARAYLDALATRSDEVQLQLADQVLEPELARKLKVRSNGYLVIERGDKNESIHLGLDVEEARATLRNLDAKVHEDLLRLVRPPRKAYFTTGHLERDWAAPADDTREGVRNLRRLFEALGFHVQRLGLGDGLGSRIPDDATVVVVAGPLEPFLPEERATLEEYAARGGRLFIFLDPDRGVTEDELLASLGVKVTKALVANDNPRYLLRMPGRHESPYDMGTVRASAHPSVTTLSRAGGRLWVALFGSGSVSKLPKPPPGLEVTFTLGAMPRSWVDFNGNGAFDAKSEKRSDVELAVAMERKVAAGSPQSAGGNSGASKDAANKDPAAKNGESKSTASGQAAGEEVGGKKQPPMRAIVVGDTDLAADEALGNAGNVSFVADGLRWLAGDEETAGTIESEKDVPIVHRKEGDTVWFYGTSFLVPAMVLAGGLFVSRKGSRKRRAS